MVPLTLGTPTKPSHNLSGATYKTVALVITMQSTKLETVYAPTSTHVLAVSHYEKQCKTDLYNKILKYRV